MWALLFMYVQTHNTYQYLFLSEGPWYIIILLYYSLFFKYSTMHIYYLYKKIPLKIVPYGSIHSKLAWLQPNFYY